MATLTLTPTNYYKVWWWDTASFEAISSDKLMISDSVYPVLQFPGTAGLTSASISKIALTLKKGATGSAYTVDIGMGISNTNTVSSFPSGGSKTISNNGTAVWTLSAFPSSVTPALPWNLMLSPLSRSGDTFMYFSFVSLVITYTPPYTACGPPTTVSVSANNVRPDTEVTLTWSGATGGTNNSINGYDIYRSTAAESGYILLASIASTSTTGSALIAAPAIKGTAYYYKIVTKGTAGASYSSGISSVYATLNAAPYGNTVKCYHNGRFVKCEVYYCSDSTFAECIPFYLHGGTWVECNAG